MKTYFTKSGFWQADEPRVYVREEEINRITRLGMIHRKPTERPLEHHVYHSPDGHSWGYMGSGPAELAKDILWDLLGAEPIPAIYQKFKGDFIAPLPQDEGFTITEQSIRDWIMAYGFAPERMVVQRSTV